MNDKRCDKKIYEKPVVGVLAPCACVITESGFVDMPL